MVTRKRHDAALLVLLFERQKCLLKSLNANFHSVQNLVLQPAVENLKTETYKTVILTVKIHVRPSRKTQTELA